MFISSFQRFIYTSKCEANKSASNESLLALKVIAVFEKYQLPDPNSPHKSWYIGTNKGWVVPEIYLKYEMNKSSVEIDNFTRKSGKMFIQPPFMF